MNGVLKRYLSNDGAVVCSVLEGTEMIAELERIHHPSAVVTAALGRLSMAASLIGYSLKGADDAVTLRLDGGGPAGVLLAVATADGTVKSYAENRFVELPLNSAGKLDVAGAVGTTGNLYVMKDLGLKEPYTGQIQLVSGEIAEDITQYFAVSEQIPTACGLGVLVAKDLTVAAAGGYLIQLLPFAPEETIARLEQNLSSVVSITALLEQGLHAEDIALRLLDGLEPELLDAATPAYHCDCSRARTTRMLASLDQQTLLDMADEMPDIEVCCHFCANQYHFTPDEIRALCNKPNATTEQNLEND